MTTGDVSLAAAVPPGASTAKKVTVATLVSIGAVVGVVGQAIDAISLSQRQRIALAPKVGSAFKKLIPKTEFMTYYSIIVICG